MQKSIPFKVISSYEPAGDQAQAIDKIANGILSGFNRQTLKGVTGSGKTFTIAKVIEKIQRPSLIISHNKTLAAQLYKEFKEFFPNNAVEYFVSTYDYYQPEAYVPGKDLYIEKETDINDEIEKLRMHGCFSLLERKDVIVISTVSCIYGLGSPVTLEEMILPLFVGMKWEQERISKRLVELQYISEPSGITKRGSFSIKGDLVEIWPGYLDNPIRINIDWDEITSIEEINFLNKNIISNYSDYALYPAKQFVMEKEAVNSALFRIRKEMEERVNFFNNNNKPLEAERIKTRVEYDLDMLSEIGYCSGIENYSRQLSNRAPGSRPDVLLDYFPKDFITFIDESHITLSQIGAMYEGDRSRKQNLVDFGFRLPSALDNRPLKFAEFDKIANQRVYISATPGSKELEESKQIVEQIIRPTGLLDPTIEVKPTLGQMEDLYGEMQKEIKKGGRILITTLTKKMAEELTNYLLNLDIKVQYLHSEIETIKRVEILTDLRKGKYDAIVGINLLREGLDLPEVTLIAILDADKIGFLRSASSLIQTIGRAARNAEGRVIMYADNISPAMKEAIDETSQRRKKQEDFNREHNIVPKTIKKAIDDILNRTKKEKEKIQEEEIKIRKSSYNMLIPRERNKLIKELEKEMLKAAEALEFEKAASFRDEINNIKQGKY